MVQNVSAVPKLRLSRNVETEFSFENEERKSRNIFLKQRKYNDKAITERSRDTKMRGDF